MERRSIHKKSLRIFFVAMACFAVAIIVAMFDIENEYIDFWFIGMPAIFSAFLVSIGCFCFMAESIKEKGRDVDLEFDEDQFEKPIKGVTGKVCKYCGTENALEDRKCHTCGAGLKRLTKKKKD